MRLFKRSQEININEIITNINKKELPKRYCQFLFGIFLIALAFNLFYAPYNIITGGSTGVSLIFRELVNLDPSITVLIISIISIIFSYFFLDLNTTKKTVIGTLLFPIFIKFTAILATHIDLGNISIILLMIYGGLITGIGNGLMLRTGFTNGGFTVSYQIMQKYLKISIGKANLITNGILILLGSFIFGIPNLFYAIITIAISSYFTDRIILGISDSKTFYIVTNKEKEVGEFIIQTLHHSATIINSKGGYANTNQKTIMCVIPTKEYFLVKEVVHEIDPQSFFLITDAYEVEGGS